MPSILASLSFMYRISDRTSPHCRPATNMDAPTDITKVETPMSISGQ
jgi:hypothetical protein